MILTEQSKTRTIAACYCRLSDDDAADGTSVSIATQTKLLGDYCREHGYEIHDFYQDDGYTGTNFERPAFKRMMADADVGAVNTIVVKDLSRFGREHLQVGQYLQVILPEKGIRFIAVGDDVDSAKGSLDYDLMVPIKNIFNEYYPADCSRKTRLALKTKAENGEFIAACAPYGYRKSKEDKHILEIDERTAPIVKEIFEMAAYQGYGYDKIARILKARKILTPSAYVAETEGRATAKDPYDWNLTSVYTMLANRTYLGHCVNGKRTVLSFKNKKVVRKTEDQWIVVENAFPAIITEQLWNDAHERLKTRKHESRTGFVNIFAGLLKCETCGYSLVLSNTKDHTNYYVCNTYKKKGPDACTSHYIRYDELYSTVLEDIQKVSAAAREDRKMLIEKILARLDDGGDSGRRQLERERDELTGKIADLDRMYKQLYGDRFKGVLSERKFTELAGDCEAAQTRAEERLDEVKRALEEQREAEDCAEKFADLAAEYADVTELNREVLNRLIASITVGDRVRENGKTTQKITIRYKFIGTF
ncbi:MAG: recombinase family protein [Clostridia bacterium]|nr:recombinase family protein [Clostridia bacterium]